MGSTAARVQTVRQLANCCRQEALLARGPISVRAVLCRWGSVCLADRQVFVLRLHVTSQPQPSYPLTLTMPADHLIICL